MIRRLSIFALLLLPLAAHATVTNTATSVSFTCTGSTGPFAFSFPVISPSALVVTQNGTVLTVTSQYTIAPVNNSYSNGGSVTLNTVCPSPQTLVLSRDTPLTQTTHYYQNMPALYSNFEQNLDQLTEITQEISDDYCSMLNPAGCALAGPLSAKSADCSPSNPYLEYNGVCGAGGQGGGAYVPLPWPTCTAYRGVVDVTNCGAVADGAFVTNGCGAGDNCWKSPSGAQTANNTAIRAAISAAGAADGVVLFPPSGTNVWIVGGTGTCTQPSGDGLLNAVFNIPNNVTIQGSGLNSTVVMAAPLTNLSGQCALLTNSQEPAYAITIEDMRLDGNEPTDGTHNDYLHPNNNLSTGSGNLGAVYVAPGSSLNPPQLDIPALISRRVQYTGFTGINVGESSSYPTILQFVVWSGSFGFVGFDHNAFYFNQWAGAIFSQSSDSLWNQNYFVQNGNWNNVPTAVEWNNGGSRWTSNYFGGGYATNFVGFGVFGDYIADNINDFPGAGNITACTGGAVGCGENWQFVDGFVPGTGARYSTNNMLVDNGATDTYTGYPAVSFEGSSTNNTIVGMEFYNVSGGTLPTYFVQEKGSATHTTVINPVVSETPSTGNWSFTNAANSYVLGANGVKDTYGTGNLGDWTDSGVASNNVPLWNSGTGKWTPGPVAFSQLTGAATAGQLPTSVPLSGVGGTGTGLAACYITATAPPTLGHCTTIVGSSGGCTCAAN